MKLMSLEFPLGKEILTTARLVTGGVCALLGFGLDDAEDCKVCVTESLLLLLHGGARNVRLSFEREDRLMVRLEGDGAEELGSSEGEEISIALLSALVEGLEIKKEGKCARISFGFGTL